jgi:hypothetical protein
VTQLELGKYEVGGKSMLQKWLELCL